MIIHQVLPTFTSGDAVSNEALMMKRLLLQMGHSSEIYAQNIHDSVKKLAVRLQQKSTDLEKADLIIYHFSIGSPVLELLMDLKHPKLVMRYHNITPGHFFATVSPAFKVEVDSGRQQLKKYNNRFMNILADSLYNKQDLMEMSFSAEQISVLPMIIDFEQYQKKPDEIMLKKMQDGKTNILFVGRVAPNKCHEDLIKTIYYYQKYYHSDCRLILAGAQHYPTYNLILANLVRELRLGDVVYFTGHISFSELIALYQSAHVFLSMSEHEGFCVPVLESMYFDIPVIAYRSTALPETMGENSLLLAQKDFRIAAGTIHRVVNDVALNAYIRQKQKTHLQKYSIEQIGQEFTLYINNLTSR